jgi:putative transposase
VLCAWGISEGGERVLLDVCLGMREAEEDWLELGRSRTRRGLRAPLLVVADGAPGLVNAIEQLWPDADRQRCTVHRPRNVLAKLPERERERVKAAYWRALDEASSQQDGERRPRALVGELADAGHTAAAACLADDLEALTAHLRYPRKHRRVWRSTNLLERSLGEVKRRTKLIGRSPAETSCLSLCSAVLDLVIAAANRIRSDDFDRQLTAPIATEQNRDQEQEVVAP